MPWRAPLLKWAARRRPLEFVEYRIQQFITGYNPAAWVFSAMPLGFLGLLEFRSRNSSARMKRRPESKVVVHPALFHDDKDRKTRVS